MHYETIGILICRIHRTDLALFQYCNSFDDGGRDLRPIDVRYSD